MQSAKIQDLFIKYATFVHNQAVLYKRKQKRE